MIFGEFCRYLEPLCKPLIRPPSLSLACSWRTSLFQHWLSHSPLCCLKERPCSLPIVTVGTSQGFLYKADAQTSHSTTNRYVWGPGPQALLHSPSPLFSKTYNSFPLLEPHLPSLLRCYGPYLGPTRTQAWGFGPCSPLRPWVPSQRSLPLPWHISASGDLKEQPEACLPTFMGGGEKQHSAGSWTALSFEVPCKGGTVGFSLCNDWRNRGRQGHTAESQKEGNSFS